MNLIPSYLTFGPFSKMTSRILVEILRGEGYFDTNCGRTELIIPSNYILREAAVEYWPLPVNFHCISSWEPCGEMTSWSLVQRLKNSWMWPTEMPYCMSTSLSNLCDDQDMDPFNFSIIMTVGDRKTTILALLLATAYRGARLWTLYGA